MSTSTAVSLAAVPRPLHPPPSAAPFIKWVGGKGRLMRQLTPLLPRDMQRRRLVEPFVGGGAMFFAQQPASALLCDINASLVTTYGAVRDDVEGVIRKLRTLQRDHSDAHYYDMREKYNHGRMHAATRAAMFVYLNKTCFNGLHRVNARGEFNVPMGRYANPTICNEQVLRSASEALQVAEIKNQGFEALLSDAQRGDFVYLDPPYHPVSDTANFTNYAIDGFRAEDQTRLRDVCNDLDRRGIKFMLSNSDAPLIRRLYRDFRIETIAGTTGNQLRLDEARSGDRSHRPQLHRLA